MFFHNVDKNKPLRYVISSSVKRKLWLLIIVAAIFVAIVYGISFIGLGIGAYQSRLVECEANKLLPEVERKFNCNFPTDLSRLRVAKTKDIDGLVLFAVKFDADSGVVRSFLESFPRKLGMKSYSSEWDSRNLWVFTPRWFKMPIEKGEIWTVESVTEFVGTKSDIYIDMADANSYVVYFNGKYSTRKYKVQGQ